MRRGLALGAVSALALVLVTSTAFATHGLPWVEGSGIQLNMFGGPDQLESDEPFHIRHGWTEIVVDKEKHKKNFSVTVRAKTGADVDNQFAVGTFLIPTLSNCDPAGPFGPDPDCRLFLFDVPGGLESLPGYDGGPVQFVADWYMPCGQTFAPNAVNADCGLDEDQVVAVLHRELTVSSDLNPDSDLDGRPDSDDDCPTGDAGWNSNDPLQDHDSDGCRDTTEDEDDDNDGTLDIDDDCDPDTEFSDPSDTGSENSDVGWDSNDPTQDHDKDGCRDATEDLDDDNDQTADADDSCPKGDKHWDSTDPTQDNDADGCRDATEDLDDDNDGVPDIDDPAPLDPNVP